MENIAQATIIQLSNKWYLSGSVLIDNANQILLESKKFLIDEDDIEIDFSEVTDIDTSALSLMMEWQRRAIASHSKVTFVNLPVNLNSLATLYGVADFIQSSAT